MWTAPSERMQCSFGVPIIFSSRFFCTNSTSAAGLEPNFPASVLSMRMPPSRKSAKRFVLFSSLSSFNCVCPKIVCLAFAYFVSSWRYFSTDDSSDQCVHTYRAHVRYPKQ